MNQEEGTQQAKSTQKSFKQRRTFGKDVYSKCRFACLAAKQQPSQLYRLCMVCLLLALQVVE